MERENKFVDEIERKKVGPLPKKERCKMSGTT
jgi:hypothetical protein